MIDATTAREYGFDLPRREWQDEENHRFTRILRAIGEIMSKKKSKKKKKIKTAVC